MKYKFPNIMKYDKPKIQESQGIPSKILKTYKT